MAMDNTDVEYIAEIIDLLKEIKRELQNIKIKMG